MVSFVPACEPLVLEGRLHAGSRARLWTEAFSGLVSTATHRHAQSYLPRKKNGCFRGNETRIEQYEADTR